MGSSRRGRGAAAVGPVTRVPARAHEVNRAYAQSADLVEHLLRNNSDRQRLPELLRHVASGMSFDEAFSPPTTSTSPTWTANGARPWASAFVCCLSFSPAPRSGRHRGARGAGFVRRRRDHHAKLARWAEEEAAHEQALQTLELSRQAALREEAAREANVVPNLPRDSGIPTVEHEGRDTHCTDARIV